MKRIEIAGDNGCVVAVIFGQLGKRSDDVIGFVAGDFDTWDAKRSNEFAGIVKLNF